ncbi:MAG: SH3 domain-containing protein [Phyllobacterium sp.]|uniref:SH3 domain-containing protein n=1 Tax=Phyllobacterium sp. TaxID=1871046 RepID=UPI0030F24A44
MFSGVSRPTLLSLTSFSGGGDLKSVALVSTGKNAGFAAADVAYTTGNVNLRTGPGTTYTRVGTLPAGLRFNVLACQSDWCHVGHQGVRVGSRPTTLTGR